NLSMKYQTERSDLESSDPIRLLVRALQSMLAAECHVAVCAVSVVYFETSRLTNAMNQLAKEEELYVEDGKDFTNARKGGRLLERLRFDRPPRIAKARRWKVTGAGLKALARAYGMVLSGVSEPPKVNDTNGKTSLWEDGEQSGRGDAWEG